MLLQAHALRGRLCTFVIVQDKPYALFGTCLGAIIAYEVARQVQERKHAPAPVAFFPSAVSAPHLYAIAVMKLYVQHQVGAAGQQTRLAALPRALPGKQDSCRCVCCVVQSTMSRRH